MQNLTKIVGLLFILTLALSLAVAQASTQNSQSQTAPNAQSQSSGQSPAGSQPQNAPQGQAGSTSNAQQGGAAQGGSAEDELHLTDAQKQQLRPIIEEEVKQINAVRDDQSLNMDQKRAKVEQIRQTEFPKIQAILTPEQVTKLKEMQQKARQQGQGSAPASQQPPQQQPH